MTPFQRLFGSGPMILIGEMVLVFLAVYAQSVSNLPRPPWPRWCGAVVGVTAATLSLGFSLWSVQVLPFKQRGRRLITSGPFGMVRHPLYSGMLAAGGSGTFLVGHTYFGVLIWLVSYAIASLLVRHEERLLRDQFGVEWSAYASRTPRFIPRILPQASA